MSARNPSRAGSFCKCANRIHFASSPLLLLLLILPSSSFAQLISSSTTGNPDDSTSSVIATTLPSTVSLIASTLLTIATPTESSASPSSSFSTSTKSRAPVGTAAPTGSEAPDIDPSDERKSSVLNYYFVFLAIFAVIIFGAAYYLHRRKKLRKAQFRNSSQNALARDLDGWVISRRGSVAASGSVVASEDQAISRPAMAARHEPRLVSSPISHSTPDWTNELLSQNRSEDS